MATFILTPTVAGYLPNKFRALVIQAEDIGDARTFAKNLYSGVPEAIWDSATALTLTDVIMTTANAFVGWVMRITVNDTAGAIVADVSVTGDATDDTLDEMGTAMEVALNATASIAGADYTTATQTLIVALGSGGDDLGDHTVLFSLTPPTSVTVPAGDADVSFADIVSTLTHEGVSTADLTIVFVADTIVLPTLVTAI